MPWTESLLAAVEAGHVAAAEFTPAQRQQLRQRPKGRMGDRIDKLFPAISSDRAALIKNFASVAELAGRPEAGAAHFERLCGSCHALRGRGHSVGPDLAAFRPKPVADFLTAILDPTQPSSRVTWRGAPR
jgi:mono/diheme cytochrome c family protein